MDSVGLANTFVAMNQAQTGQAIQAEMMKMAAQQDANLVALLQQGAENLQTTQAAPPPGLGSQVDVTA
ncbi:putative motility protein [Labrenzia sp. PHM005]|uniref:putative motility protein n=1 Tax=Labrenzia sp. PHM005 TaxID=2590016 RepID=UPI0011408EDA|nr:putative motility protein [Labrenzia sp. PHM005]QDG75291.1 putative motility protein [Labrenzia sp. PHM005]